VKLGVFSWWNGQHALHSRPALRSFKEGAMRLDKVVRAETISQIVVSCDDTTRPTLMEQLPAHLREKLVDVGHLGIDAPGHEVLAETMAVIRQQDHDTDAEHVQAMLDAWRAGGLAVAGPEDTLQALAMGQVEELQIAARPETLRSPVSLPDAAPGPVEIETSTPSAALDPSHWKIADELVTRAQQTSARIRFIEDPSLLSAVGGVGALLRFRI
jgi:peptide subunit release factor 1 (eRF1)